MSNNKSKGKAISLKNAQVNIPTNNNRNRNNNNNKTKGQALNTNKSTKSKLAKQKMTQGGGFRVKHSELIQVVNDTNGFGVNKIDINPGIATTFPWLSAVAQRYEEYKFHKLSFEFVSRCSATKVGSLILSPDYDPDDYGVPTEAQMSFYKNAIEDSQWKDIIMSMSTSDMNVTGSRKYVRSELIAGTLKNYDSGKLWIGTNGDGVTSIGKLWVHYDVELFTPASDLIENQNWLTPDIYSRIVDAEQTFINALNTPVLFGNLRGSGKLPVVYDEVTGSFTLPRGSYRVTVTLPYRVSAPGEDDWVEYSIRRVSGTPAPLFTTPQYLQGTGDLVQTPLHINQILHLHSATSIAIYLLANFLSGTARLEFSSALALFASIDIQLL